MSKNAARRRGEAGGGANDDRFNRKQRGWSRAGKLPPAAGRVNHPGVAFGAVELFYPEELLIGALLDPRLAEWIGLFIAGLPERRPLCVNLACDFEFTTVSPPARWIFTTTETHAALAGACSRCASKMSDGELMRAAAGLAGGRIVEAAQLHRAGGRA